MPEKWSVEVPGSQRTDSQKGRVEYREDEKDRNTHPELKKK